MNYQLLADILHIDDFIIEEEAVVDEAITTPLRPLYIEKIYLYPDLIERLANDIVLDLEGKEFDIIYTIEASVLPLAALIAVHMGVPLTIIRKTSNFKHEGKEPEIFLRSDYSNKKGLLFDDAVWSGKTLNMACDIIARQNIKIQESYFVFDFLDFKGGKELKREAETLLKKHSCWIKYQELLEICRKEELLSEAGYAGIMKLF